MTLGQIKLLVSTPDGDAAFFVFSGMQVQPPLFAWSHDHPTLSTRISDSGRHWGLIAFSTHIELGPRDDRFSMPELILHGKR